MAVSGISVSLQSLNSSTVKSKAQESLQQLAQEGDPTAIAELRQQQELEHPTQKTGAAEPGKGQQFDSYV
jgi:hypothetical protein